MCLFAPRVSAAWVVMLNALTVLVETVSQHWVSAGEAVSRAGRDPPAVHHVVRATTGNSVLRSAAPSVLGRSVVQLKVKTYLTTG